MLPLRHGQYFVMAQFHIAEADKDAVGHGAVPHLRVGKRAKPDFVKIRLHIQQQTTAGHKIDLQNISVLCFDR